MAITLNKPGSLIRFPFPGDPQVTVNLIAPDRTSGDEIWRLLLQIGDSVPGAFSHMPRLLGLALHSISGVDAGDGKLETWTPEKTSTGELTPASWERVLPYAPTLQRLVERLVHARPDDLKNC